MLVYYILAALLGAAAALAIYIFLHKRSLAGKKEEYSNRLNWKLRTSRRKRSSRLRRNTCS